MEESRKKGDGHDRLLRNNLDGTLDLDILVSNMVTRVEMITHIRHIDEIA